MCKWIWKGHDGGISGGSATGLTSFILLNFSMEVCVVIVCSGSQMITP